MKRYWLWFLLLVFAPSVFAQSTTVSGTITDAPDGQAWFNGTYSFVFRVSPSNPTGQYFWNGAPFSTSQTIAGNLNGSGAYSVSIPSNTAITPSGSTWDLTVCPLATASCFTTQSNTITGATQNVSPVPPSIRIIMTSPPQNTRAYTDGELVSGQLGQSYYNIIDQTLHYCQIFPCGWAQISGGGGGSLPTGANGDVQTKNGSVLAGGCINAPAAGPTKVNCDFQMQGPNLRVDGRNYGMRAVNPNSTPAIPGCTATTVDSTHFTLSSACGLITGDNIDIRTAGPTPSISTPSAPTVTPSLPQGSTGVGVVVNGPTGATSYGYETAAIDAGQGVTAASAATTISTGASSLGAQSVNISSQARALFTTTVTTSSAHGLPVGCIDGSANFSLRCPLVYIGSGNSLTDIVEYAGWFIVTSVVDTTHFTYVSGNDVRYGVNSASSTGGTVLWFNANSLQLPTSNPAGVRQYAIYGRNCPATCNLIGLSMPVNTSITSDPTYMVWDDYGPTMMGNATFPSWIPATAPGSASNDTFTTTISAGGGTTSITTATPASNSVAGATILIDAGPGLVSCVSATASTGGTCYIPIPTSNPTINKYVVNSYTDLGAVNNSASISQAGGILLNDTVVWNNGRWWGDVDPSSVATVFPQFGYEAHANIAVGAAYPGLFIKGGGAFRGLGFSTTAANLYNEIFNVSGGPMIFENDSWSGGSGNDLMGIEYYGFTSQGGGFGGNFRNFTFTTSTPNSSTATPLFVSKNNGEWNFHYGSCSNRGFTFIAGTNGGTNILWDLGEECQAGSMPELVFMSRGVGGTISWVSGSLDTDSNPGAANWASTGTPSVSFSGPGSGTSGGFAFLTGRPFASVGVGGVQNTAQTGQNFNLTTSGCGFIFDGNLNIPCASINRINQIVGPNSFVYSDPGVPPAPTCAVITAGPPFPPAGTYNFNYTAIYPNGGQSLTSPSSNSCTVDGATQQISITYTLLNGVTGYVWLDGVNFPNVNGVNCVHTTIPPTTSWTFQGGFCGFESLPNFPGGGAAGFGGTQSWSSTSQIGQYIDFLGGSPPSNAGSGKYRLYANNGNPNGLRCVTSTGNNCLGTLNLNSYSANHTLNINENEVTATATLTLTLPHAVNNWGWDIQSVSGATTLTIDSGNLYVGGAIGPITIPNSQGVHAWCDGTNCYAFGLGSGGGGGSPGGSVNAFQINNGAGGFAGVNSPTVNGNYVVNYNVTASASVAPTINIVGVPVNQQTGTTYTYLYSDRASDVRANNSGAQTYTLVNPSSVGFGQNFFNVLQNVGTGAVTENASGFTVNGGASLLVPPNWTRWLWSDGVNYFAHRAPDFNAFVDCHGGGNALQFTAATGLFTCGASSAGVSSLTGDNGLFCNSASTGVVTLATCATTLAHKYWGNNTGSTGTAAFFSIVEADLPATTVFTDKAATFGAFLYDFSASTVKIPTGGGFTAGPSSMFGYDSTAKNCHVEANNADGICGAFAAASPPSNKQVVQALVSSNNVLLQGIDWPEIQVIPAANCNNTTAGAGWSIGSGGTVTCRAGTNNKGSYISITDTSTTFATFQTVIPQDWDSSTNPYIRFQLASTDATNLHTIIPSIQVACYKGDGSTTDDVAPNAAHSLSTVTLNGNANRFWSTSNVQMNGTDMTGCVAGALMQVTVGRATDTATNAEFYSATLTFPRLPVVQAN